MERGQSLDESLPPDRLGDWVRMVTMPLRRGTAPRSWGLGALRELSDDLIKFGSDKISQAAKRGQLCGGRWHWCLVSDLGLSVLEAWMLLQQRQTKDGV